MRTHNQLGFAIVEVDPATVDRLNAARTVVQPLASMNRSGRVDTIGPGDVLEIHIYEVGVTLFGTGLPTGAGFDPSARGTTLANVVVDGDGNIQLPYIGRIHAAGNTPAGVQRLIERAMSGMSQRPQASVIVAQNLYNTFYVSGDVRSPGRFNLALPRERLLDALARAGGTVNQPNDMVVRLTRDGTMSETRLSDIDAAGPQNLELLPGDRVELFNRPRTYLAFGAIDKVSQQPFGQSALSLGEAVARIGGPSERVANPAAVYLFRYGSTDPAQPGQPVIYRLDMTRAQSYFLAQRFEMQDKDVIYVASAASNAPTKVTQILGQLFTPFLTARVLTQ